MPDINKSFNESLFETYVKCATVYVNHISGGGADFSYFSKYGTPRKIMISLYTMAVAKGSLVSMSLIPQQQKVEIFEDAKHFWPGADTNNLIRMSICIYTTLWFCENMIK